MSPFATEWSRDALDGLAEAWVQATDRNAVTRAAEEIERRLARDPLNEGRLLHEDLYRLDEAPLVAFYTVDVAARSVQVTGLRYVP